MSLKFIDLFAGCGGLSLGLEQAGFIPVYVNELNKDALETYLINGWTVSPTGQKKLNLSLIEKFYPKKKRKNS